MNLYWNQTKWIKLHLTLKTVKFWKYNLTLSSRYRSLLNKMVVWIRNTCFWICVKIEMSFFPQEGNSPAASQGVIALHCDISHYLRQITNTVATFDVAWDYSTVLKHSPWQKVVDTLFDLDWKRAPASGRANISGFCLQRKLCTYEKGAASLWPQP